MKKENWIEEILDGTNHIVKVVPDDMLFLKIQNKIKIQNNISLELFWLVAASFLILVSLNIKIVFSEIKSGKNQNETFALIMTDSNQLYTQ